MNKILTIKNMKKLIICLITILLLGTLSSCKNKEAKIKDSLATEILEAYKTKNNLQNSDLKIEYYFGKYNKYHVVYISKDVDAFIDRHIKIGDYMFMYSVNKALEVYKDGEFYTIGDLYKAGLIKQKNLKKIYNKTDAFLEKIVYSYNDFLKGRGLSVEDYNKIVSIYQKDRIVDYYGEYNGLDIVALNSLKTDKEFVYTMDIMWDQFKYDMIRAFDEEKMYTLKEIYDENKITKDELVELFQVIYGYLPYTIIGNSKEELSSHASFALVTSYYNDVYSKENGELSLIELWEKYNQSPYCYLHNNLKTVWLYTEGASNGGHYTINVGGYDFTVNNNQVIFVYFSGEHHTLGKAYDEGLLSDNELEEVYLASLTQ